MLINSAAGEQVARQIAMRSATDNADDILSELHLLYNHMRQDAITTELNEIVGGEDALEDTFVPRARKFLLAAYSFQCCQPFDAHSFLVKLARLPRRCRNRSRDVRAARPSSRV